MDNALRKYIWEAVLFELQRDDRMTSLLRRSGLGMSRNSNEIDAQGVAQDWISDTEAELGHEISHATKSRAVKFVVMRWQGLLTRFRGDKHAATQTLYNLLNTKFNELRAEEQHEF